MKLICAATPNEWERQHRPFESAGGEEVEPMPGGTCPRCLRPAWAPHPLPTRHHEWSELP